MKKKNIFLKTFLLLCILSAGIGKHTTAHGTTATEIVTFPIKHIALSGQHASRAIKEAALGTWNTGAEIGKTVLHAMPLTLCLATFLGADYFLGKIISKPIFNYRFGTISNAVIQKANSVAEATNTKIQKFTTMFYLLKQYYYAKKKVATAKEKVTSVKEKINAAVKKKVDGAKKKISSSLNTLKNLAPGWKL